MVGADNDGFLFSGLPSVLHVSGSPREGEQTQGCVGRTHLDRRAGQEPFTYGRLAGGWRCSVGSYSVASGLRISVMSCGLPCSAASRISVRSRSRSTASPSCRPWPWTQARAARQMLSHPVSLSGWAAPMRVWVVCAGSLPVNDRTATGLEASPTTPCTVAMVRPWKWFPGVEVPGPVGTEAVHGVSSVEEPLLGRWQGLFGVPWLESLHVVFGVHHGPPSS